MQIINCQNVARLDSDDLMEFVREPLMRLFRADPVGSRVDSRSLIVSAQEALVHLLQTIAEEKRPPLLDLISTSTEVQAGSESARLREITGGGEMKPLAPGADDMPLVHESGKPFDLYNVAHALGASWNYQELLKSALSGQPLPARKMRLISRGYDERRERILLLGDKSVGLKGVINNDRIARPLLTLDGSDDTTAAVPDGTGSDTAAQIFTAVARFLDDVAEDSNDAIEASGILCVPPKTLRHWENTQFENTNPESIKERIERKKGISIVKSVRLKDVDGDDCGLTSGTTYQWMALLSSDPMICEHHLPHPHQFFAPQQRGMTTILPSYAEIADLAVYDPKALKAAYWQSS